MTRLALLEGSGTFMSRPLFESIKRSEIILFDLVR